MHSSKSIIKTSKCFTVVRRVEFHETDMAGIVHFSNVFRFVEYAESAFFRNGGTSVYGWPIISTGCDYIRAMKFDYELDISIAVEEIGNKSLKLIFDIEYQEQSRPKKLMATGFLTVIYASVIPGDEIRTMRIPDQFRSYFQEYLLKPEAPK